MPVTQSKKEELKSRNGQFKRLQEGTSPSSGVVYYSPRGGDRIVVRGKFVSFYQGISSVDLERWTPERDLFPRLRPDL